MEFYEEVGGIMWLDDMALELLQSVAIVALAVVAICHRYIRHGGK